jgi:ADP-ribose pyrophosphatase YjhB (NUDIX family)
LGSIHDPSHPHDPHDPPDYGLRFCPKCAGPLAGEREAKGEPPFPTCSACGFIYYFDPKLAAGVIPRIGDRIALIRRAIEPGLGLWTFPAGYVNRGEKVEEAAARETLEEACLDVEIDRLVGVYSYTGRPVVIVVYTGPATGGALGCGVEAAEARAFAPSEIPWDELAFASVRDGLRDFLGLSSRENS